MSDENVADSVTPNDTTRQSRTAETSLGMDQNVAAAVAYILGFLSGLVVFFAEDENQQVRWHGAQSMVVFGGLVIGVWVLNTVLWTLFWSISNFGIWGIISLLTTLLWLGIFVMWIYLVVTAYQGKTVRVPVAGGIADGLVN
jgi:uncharacterized membrane protein